MYVCVCSAQTAHQISHCIIVSTSTITLVAIMDALLRDTHGEDIVFAQHRDGVHVTLNSL